MQHYRAYTVGKDGNFIRFRAFLCSNDEDAIVWTKQLLDGLPIELWNDKRFILRVDSPPTAHDKGEGATFGRELSAPCGGS